MWHDKMLACSRPVWNFSHSCITLSAKNSGSLKLSCCSESKHERKLKRARVVPYIVRGTSNCRDWRNDNLGQLNHAEGISLESKSRTVTSPSIWQWQGVVVSVRAQGSRSVVTFARSASSSLAVTMTAVVPKRVGMAGLTNCEAGMHMYNLAEREQETNVAAENEQLRRHRISVANKGKVPWNKGGKHSAETIKRIKEKTSQAMQSPTVTTSEPPSVMAKLRLNARHSQTNETKLKIREKLRSRWDTKKRIRGYQEILLKEWKNCVAEAARMGALGEIEMQWTSYSVLKKKLRSDTAPRSQLEEKKKAKAKAKATRSSKSEEHRLKISAAIRAKWEDPEYKAKVKQGMVKNSDAVKAMKRSQRRNPTGDNITAEAGCIKGPLDHGFVTAVMLGEKKRRKEHGAAKKQKDESSIGAAAKTKLRSRNIKVDLLKRCAVPAQLEEEDDILEDDVTEELSVSAEHSFVDPQAGEKLFRLKLLQASRSVMIQRRREATHRAKVLMAEAEKAAKKLEAAAGNNEFAHASLAEIYRLIAEAEHFIQAADSLHKDIDGTKPDGHMWRNTLGLYHSSRFQHESTKRTGENTMLSANYEEMHGHDLSKQSGQDIALGVKTTSAISDGAQIMMFGSDMTEESVWSVHNPFKNESHGRSTFSGTVSILNGNASRNIRSMKTTESTAHFESQQHVRLVTVEKENEV